MPHHPGEVARRQGAHGRQVREQTAGTVQLYWLSYTGTLVYYYTVPPGKTLPVKTFATNAWLAMNSKFVCIGYVVAPKTTYVIQ